MSKRRPLTADEVADAARLDAHWQKYKASHPGATQEWLAGRLGTTQGAVNHYFRGRIPLNLPALLRFCLALDAHPGAISPRLASMLEQVTDLASQINESTSAYADRTPMEQQLLEYIRRHGGNHDGRDALSRRALLLLHLVESPIPNEKMEALGWSAFDKPQQR